VETVLSSAFEAFWPLFAAWAFKVGREAILKNTEKQDFLRRQSRLDLIKDFAWVHSQATWAVSKSKTDAQKMQVLRSLERALPDMDLSEMSYASACIDTCFNQLNKP
jgi:hypothetical protein